MKLYFDFVSTRVDPARRPLAQNSYHRGRQPQRIPLGDVRELTDEHLPQYLPAGFETWKVYEMRPIGHATMTVVSLYGD